MDNDIKLKNIGYCRDCQHWMKNDRTVVFLFRDAGVGRCIMPIESLHCTTYTDTDGVKRLALDSEVKYSSLKVGVRSVNAVIESINDFNEACFITASDHGCLEYIKRT